MAPEKSQGKSPLGIRYLYPDATSGSFTPVDDDLLSDLTRREAQTLAVALGLCPGSDPQDHQAASTPTKP